MAVIGLDATSISISGKGLYRYQYGLIKSLSKLDRENCYYVFLNAKNIIPELPIQDNFHYIKIHIPNRITWDQFQAPLIIRKYKLDIYHSTNDTLPVISKVKFVLLLFEIPDYRIQLLRSISHNSLYGRLSHSYNMLLFPRSLKRAKVIITSSNNTKIDLLQKYGVDEKKIRVLYPGIDERFCAANNREDLLNTRRKYNAEAGYILHISSSDPRDNTLTVISAYQRALRELRTLKKLIIFGDVDANKKGLEKLVKELNLENSIIFTGRLSEQELVALYQAADLYVDPTLFEGFGLQVVEAMACGIPVITSNVTSLPEIVGSTGILVSPTDIEGLASAMARVLIDSGLQLSLRQKSLERARFFSWDRAAQETLAIYDELHSFLNHS